LYPVNTFVFIGIKPKITDREHFWRESLKTVIFHQIFIFSFQKLKKFFEDAPDSIHGNHGQITLFNHISQQK